MVRALRRPSTKIAEAVCTVQYYVFLNSIVWPLPCFSSGCLFNSSRKKGNQNVSWHVMTSIIVVCETLDDGAAEREGERERERERTSLVAK